jgi:hypothetical protein
MLTFEQSISTLQNTADFVSEHKFLSNWLDIEHLGWRLPAISKPRDWCGLENHWLHQCRQT